MHENGASAALATFGYDDLGRRVHLARGNGTATWYAYDGASRLAAQSEDFGGTSYDRTVTFGYSPASQLTARSNSNEAFAWAGHSNASTAYTSNGLNQPTAIGSTAPTHDANGNMTADGTGATFAYDVRNRLAGASALPSFVYYEPQGRLSFIVGTTAPQVFDYVGDALVFESSAFGASYARYVHGPGTDEPIVWYDSGTVRYLHADERGTIAAVSNGSGNLTDIAKFDEYGVPQSAFAGRFGYTGQMWLPELGLYHYKARQYHPKIGRFMQIDPTGETAMPQAIGMAKAYKEIWNGLSNDEKTSVVIGAVTAIGVAWDVATIFTGVGSGPEGLVASRAIGSRIRSSPAQAAALKSNLVRQAVLGARDNVRKGGGTVFAGTGTKTPFRGAEAFAKRHGGKSEDYVEVTSDSVARTPDGRSIQVHAVRNTETGKIFDAKIKIQ